MLGKKLYLFLIILFNNSICFLSGPILIIHIKEGKNDRYNRTEYCFK